ncbi:ABC transporter permease [Paenibacillus sp. MMS18-CY102]|uniref:ABC transporter permease n=1 Tax=Paenibacillus sp. MMS18-CY102 TaxID=2682849 RepID=UPI00136617B5|nr:ABC transporter permease [Paenibacillus sp. MMS18-CY102]MWC30408.1 ABC transporter permease subunit [Paenibacillus sp. MMS18-CY102]
MGNFMDLVRNENMKIYSRMRTWIMMGILLVLMLLLSIIFANVDEEILSMWDVFFSASTLGFMFVTIFTVVVSADSVAGEFSTGTIKLLMIRPWSRSKILLSKYVSLIQFALFFSVVLFVWLYIWEGIFFGFSAGHTNNAISGAISGSIWSYVFKYYGLEFIGVIFTVTISFLLSTVFRSGGLAIGLSILMMFASSILSEILSIVDQGWVQYLWFMQTDLLQYLNNNEHEHTLGFSLGVLGVYYIVFIAVTWILFNKRDIAT